MADSDDEYERRRGRDKFKRERHDYDRRDDRRRDSMEDRRGGDAGYRRDKREMYDRRRDHYNSPPRHDMSPPVMKRMRRDWDEGGYPHYNMPYGGGHMPGPPGPGGWGGGPGGPDMHSGPHQQQFEGPMRADLDLPTQPPMLSFKAFLANQDDNINDADAIKKFSEYKIDFKKQQISDFFLSHKEEEWFKSKYHPEECDKRREDLRKALKHRLRVFMELMEAGRVAEAPCDVDKTPQLTKLLDAAVIKMEGGIDFDLAILDYVEPEKSEESSRNRKNSETQPQQSKQEKESRPKPKKPEKEDGEEDDSDQDEATPEKPEQESRTKQNSEKQNRTQKPEESKKEKFTASPDDQSNHSDSRRKRARDKADYSYESGSDSGSESGSSDSEDSEPGPPGVEESPMIDQSYDGQKDEDEEEGEEKDETKKPDSKEEGEKQEENGEEEKEKDTKEEEAVEKVPVPQALHKTCSIFLRNLAPTITKQEVEAMCKRYPGFMRVALQDPQPERRFFRRGWVTFDRTVNIKEICWNLNNIRLRDCEMGAIVNRELKQRVRPVSGYTAHKQVVMADIKHAAKVVQNLDNKWNLWDDGDEKKDEEKEINLGLVSKNPILKNITEYLVEEGSYEEDELLGVTTDEKMKDSNPEVVMERDEEFIGVLDKMILYLRIVHSFDYYSATEYPNEDEMPHRCGIMHARGPCPTNKCTQNDYNEWISNFENKVRGFTNMQMKVGHDDAVKLGLKNIDLEVEKFVTLNTQELGKDKWLCPISGKKFKGPEFVRKHIFNKHGEKVEEVKKEVAYFNNYLLDPKRPQLPEHPGNRPIGPGPMSRDQGMHPGPGFQGPNQQSMMGYQPQRPPMMYQNRQGDRNFRGHGMYNSAPYQRPEPYRQDNRRRDNYPPRGGRYQRDPRPIIEYRDLDAPDDMDIF